MIQQQRKFLPFVLGQRAACRFVASLILLALIVMGLPALSGAQQACQPDGDIDQNGSVTAADALLAFQHALSLVQLDTCQQTVADVSPQPAAPDGNITASDALCIFQKALALPSCLDILPLEVTLWLSELTQDTSQGKAIIVDYQGPSFDADDLRVSVGATPVESVFVDNQIHLILPLTQAGQTTVEFDFGGFLSSLSLNILAAPVIADPPAYVENIAADLVAGLDALREGDWQDEVDALRAVEQALPNLSEDELRELAVFLKQNLEPLLRQLNSPVLAQYDEVACRQAAERFLRSVATTVVVAGGIGIYTVVPEPSKIIGLPILLAGLVLAVQELRQDVDLVMDTCLVTGIDDIQAALVTTTGVKAAQQGPETLNTIHFDENQTKAITIALAHRFEHESRSEVLGAIRNLGSLLLKMNNGLHSVVNVLPGFLSGLSRRH